MTTQQKTVSDWREATLARMRDSQSCGEKQVTGHSLDMRRSQSFPLLQVVID
ncbi:MAG: hypothetical protein ABIW79_06520 [Gemmatimonas sp.]